MNLKKRLFKNQENVLFFKRLLNNPKALGAIVPSSKALTAMIAKQVCLKSSAYVVEVGAGTGRFTRGLLEAGLSPDRLFVVELDLELCAYLRLHFPTIHVIQGDATKLDDLLPEGVALNVETIISGIPLVNLNNEEQSNLIAAFKRILNPDGKIIQFTYSPVSPLPHIQFGLCAKRLGRVFRNLPPATVWSYKFAVDS